MGETPLAARLGVWRVTRTDAARSLYDRLESVGVYAAQLDRFERPTSPRPDPGRPGPVDRFSASRVAEVDRVPDYLRDEPLSPDDRVLTARTDGETVGVACLSQRPLYVPELHRRIRFPGAYLWRVFVQPSHRAEGVGTGLVAEAVALAGRDFGADRISALIGPDNLPSRRAFRTVGFQRGERHTAVGLLGWEHYGRSDLDDVGEWTDPIDDVSGPDP